MAEYGDATVTRNEDGSRSVLQADDVIGVSQELLDQVQLVEGLLVLDTAGEYRYRRVGPSRSDWQVTVFERVRDGGQQP
jgi:hypothetical protein